MEKMTVRDLDDVQLQGKRVLMRVDFNVPLEAGGVADDTRIRATLPTLRHLLERRVRLILMSHLGRPKGQARPELSLRPVAERLAQLIAVPVQFVPEVVGPAARDAASALQDGRILLLENLRFLPGEEANDRQLSEALAALGDLYVDDAFGTAHRAHASTVGVAEVMREQGRPVVAGFLIEKELQFLGEALSDPRRPFTAILGGAKISGKIDVIRNLLPRVDGLLIGGAMANTFFRGLGLETGASLVEEDRVPLSRELLDEAGAKLVLPVDCVVAADAVPDAVATVVPRTGIPAGGKVLDIGPATAELFRDQIRDAETVLWNGPLGLFEVAAFDAGTRAVAQAVAEATDRGATTVAGGGDTAAAIEEAGLVDRISHVSTGGGASLEFLEGRTLPGIAVLDERRTA